MNKWEWEQLDDFTFRAKVFGGWLVKILEGLPQWGLEPHVRVAAVFVPDPEHQWEINDDG